MGANPMQKMKRNSILTGLTIGLIIGLILCVFLYMFLTKSSGTGVVNKENAITVCVLNRTVKSGDTITNEDISNKVMSKENIPLDAVSVSDDVIAKIDLSAGTVLTQGMLLGIDEETITADLREQEYNMITLPTHLTEGDFIDIRLQLPNGGDYIVISKKKVLKCNASTIWLNMYEEEIELMSNAIIEYYIMAGSKLYATTYVDAGNQAAAVGTYVPNSTIYNLIKSNPNITKLINSDRYSEALTNIRNSNINTALNQYSDSAIANIEQNIKEEMKSLKESRESYFGALNAAY